MKEIPDLIDAKMVRVDKNKNQLLVWFGGQDIIIYSLATKKECDRNVVTLPIDGSKPFVPFSWVKQRMEQIIKNRR